MEIYIAFNSSPDYHAGGPSFKSAHSTLEGAMRSLYPTTTYKFSEWATGNVWDGPDGFGLIRRIELQP